MDQDAQGASSRCNIGCADNMVLISALVDSLTRCFGTPLPSSGKHGHGKGEDGVDTAATTPATGSEESGEDPRDRVNRGTSRDVGFAKELAKARKQAQRPSKHQRRLDALAKAERLKADIFRAKDGSGRVVGETKRNFGAEARQVAGAGQRGTTYKDGGGADGVEEGFRGAFCAAPRMLVGNEGMARALCFANPIREEDDDAAFFGRSRNGARRGTAQATEEEKKIDDAMAAAAAGVELLEGETLEEALIRAEARGDCGDDQTQITQTTCEDTVTSTLYFDAKYGHVIESRPPMPLYRQFQVECSEEKPNELKRIIAGKTHSSRNMGNSIVPTDWSSVPWSEWGYQPARVVAEAFESVANAATAPMQEAAAAYQAQVPVPTTGPASDNAQQRVSTQKKEEEPIKESVDVSKRAKNAAEAAVERATSPIPPSAHEHLPVDDRGVLPVQLLEDEEDDYDQDEVDQSEHQPQEATASKSSPRDPEDDHNPLDDSIDTSMESSQAPRHRERGRRRTRKLREKGHDPPTSHRRHREVGRPIDEEPPRQQGRSVRMAARSEQTNEDSKSNSRRRKQ